MPDPPTTRLQATCDACGRQTASTSGEELPDDCPACGAVLDVTLPDGSALEPLGRVGKYRLLERIGAGGMGEVFRGEHPELGHSVAIKLIRDDQVAPARRQEMLGRFRREGRISARIDHPGVVRVHDTGDDPRGVYLVMDYVRGAPLSTLLRDGPLAPHRALELAARLARTLQAVHDAGAVHRDIKPGNVLIDQRGQPRLLDFGISHLDEPVEQLTTEGQVLGTPAYMSPEQLEGQAGGIDARSDVYSLGVMLYKMLTGVSPFAGGGPMDVARRVLTLDPDPPSTRRAGLPPEIDRVVGRAMARSPADRPSSAAELAGELEALLKRPEARAAAPTTAPLAAAPRARPPVGLVAVGGAVALGLLILGVWLGSRADPTPVSRSSQGAPTRPIDPAATDPGPSPSADPKPPPVDPRPPPTDPEPPPADSTPDPTDPEPPPADPKPLPTDPKPAPPADPRPPATGPRPLTAPQRRAIQTVRELAADDRGAPAERQARLQEAIEALGSNPTESLYWRGVALKLAGAFGRAHAALQAAAARGHREAIWQQRVTWFYARGLWLHVRAAPPWLRRLDLDWPERAWPTPLPADLGASLKQRVAGCAALTSGDPAAAIGALEPLVAASRGALALDVRILLAMAYRLRGSQGDDLSAGAALAAARRISTSYPALHLATAVLAQDGAAHRALAAFRRWVSPGFPEHHLSSLIHAVQASDLPMLDRVLEQLDAIDPDGPARAWGPPMFLWAQTLPGPRSRIEVVGAGELLRRLRVSDAGAARYPSADVSRVVLSLQGEDPGLTAALDRLAGQTLGGPLRLGAWRDARRAGSRLRHGLRGFVLHDLYQLDPARTALVQFLAADDGPAEARRRAHVLLARIALVDAPSKRAARRAAEPHVAAAIELGSAPGGYPISIRPEAHDAGLKPALAAISLDLAADWHRKSRAPELVLRALRHARAFGHPWDKLRRDFRFRKLRKSAGFADLEG